MNFATAIKAKSKILITTLIKVQKCIAYAKHKVRHTQSRIEYQKPIPEEVVCFTADMQRVIVLPNLTTKEHLFVSRLVTFNETFASKTPGKPDYCILWHDAIAGYKSPDAASAFLQLICQCNEDHILLWADNCSGREKKLVFIHWSGTMCQYMGGQKL